MSDRSKWLQGLRELPEGNHFIEVTFRNVRTGASYPHVYVLHPELYKWIGGRHPQPDTPEQALACLLEMAIAGGVRPRSRQYKEEYQPVYARLQKAFLLGERGDKLRETRAKLVQAYLARHYGSPKADRVWEKARKNLDRALRKRLKTEFEADFPDASPG